MLACEEENMSDYEDRLVWLSDRIEEHYSPEESSPRCLRVTEIGTLYY